MSMNICGVDICAATLPLISTIGFEGKIANGLHSDCSGQFLVYAIGANVIKADTATGKQTFMIGHGNNVTCLDVEKCGRYIASGAMNFMGFKTDVFIWDFYSGCKLASYCNHMTRVNSVAFSHDGRFLLSVGNMDDGKVCIYDMEQRKVVCGLQAIKGTSGLPKVATAATNRNDVWVIGGDDYLATWILDTKEYRLRYEKATLRMTKRDILSVQIDGNDEFAYCGTSTGDVLKVKLNLPDRCGPTCDRLDVLGPPRNGPTLACVIGRRPCAGEKGRNNHLYTGGVTALKILDNGDFVLGSGIGKVVQAKLVGVCFRGQGIQLLQECCTPMNLRGAITSLLVNCTDLLVGTSLNEVSYTRLGCLGDNQKLMLSAHYSVVNDIVFPNCYSGVFASCNYEDVRIWNAQAMRELVRINVSNMTCHAVIFSNSGKAVISAWNDSHVRTYSVQTATPLWVIHHAHLRGVTALAITSCDGTLVTGGEEGQVRVWSLCPQQLTPIAIMKEHIGPVTAMRIKSDDCQVATSSGDGSIIIWCLSKFVRLTLILQDTLFLDVAWHPSECQILGVTHNHKLGYYETFDGATIREIVASETDPVHALDVSPDGLYIATGGGDRQVKLWSYNEGKLLRKGVVHSAEITRVRFSPDCCFILSSCQDGSIFKWDFPKDLACVSVSIVPCPGTQNFHARAEIQPVTDGGDPSVPVCS